MKKLLVAAVAFQVLAVPAAFADGRDAHQEQSMISGRPAHVEVVGGVRSTFVVTDMRKQMKGMELPRGMKDTHHIAVEFRDATSGRALIAGTVRVKVLGPAGKEQVRDLMGMHGHFGADFDLSRKGRYGIMCKFLLRDDRTRQAKFWYTVK